MCAVWWWYNVIVWVQWDSSDDDQPVRKRKLDPFERKPYPSPTCAYKIRKKWSKIEIETLLEGVDKWVDIFVCLITLTALTFLSFLNLNSVSKPCTLMIYFACYMVTRRYGIGNWKDIKLAYPGVFEERSTVYILAGIPFLALDEDLALKIWVWYLAICR